MAKREYVSKNIKNGIKAIDAQAETSGILINGHKPYWAVQVHSFDNSRDVNGNGTAHYCCTLVGIVDGFMSYPLATIVESGKRREQVGYSGANESAIYALNKLGYELDLSKVTSYDYQSTAIYPLLNFPKDSV